MPTTPKITDIEKIVDYSFEKSEKSNVLAIHPTRPLIAYLINIQRTPKISKGWTSGNDTLNSPSSSINGSLSGSDKHKTVCIRIIDYVTRQRCLAKGVYHARPVDCAFTINSLLCNQGKIIKLGVVDQLANVYLYDLSYFINELTATRIAVIRGFGQDASPYQSISLVWCPFVPCEDFDDGDGGLRLAVSTDTKIEVFAIDRLQGKTGELQRNELKGSYKCIHDAHATDIVTLSISPDCSTISSAARDNRVTFYSSDIDDGAQRSLHNWDATIQDGSKISKLFFLDDYPKLLEDSNLKFWGSAFIGTTSGLMLLVDLREWRVYQKTNIPFEGTPQKLNFDYRIDLTSRNIIAMNGNQCYIVQIAPDYRSITQTTRLALHFPVYSFVIKHKSEEELELFTISAYSLEKYIINLNTPSVEEKVVEQKSNVSASLADMFNLMNTSVSFQAAQPPVPSAAAAILASAGSGSAGSSIRGSGNTSATTNNNHNHHQHHHGKSSTIPITTSTSATTTTSTSASSAQHQVAERAPSKPSAALATAGLDVNQMDRLVEALFNKLNTSFSEGLEEFLNDIKSEVNDLKLKLNGLSRDVRKLHQQLQETRQK